MRCKSSRARSIRRCTASSTRAHHVEMGRVENGAAPGSTVSPPPGSAAFARGGHWDRLDGDPPGPGCEAR
jgi:hypothetical protein